MKKNVKLMVLTELVLLIIAILGLSLICGVGIDIIAGYLLEWVSIAFIIIVTIPSLIFMGEWQNFLKAFSVGKRKYSLLELKNINGAVSSCQKLILYGGIIGLVLQIVIILTQINNASLIGSNMAVALILIFYVAVFEYLLVPVKLNAEKVLNEEMDIDVEE